MTWIQMPPLLTEAEAFPTPNEGQVSTANSTWLDQLLNLVSRHPEQGIAPDLAEMSELELWGVFRHLSHLEADE